MKKKGYYEYDPEIYPYLLCVSIGMDEEDVNKCFEGKKASLYRLTLTVQEQCHSVACVKSLIKRCVHS